MSATLVVRHKVNNYASWRPVYDEVEPLRQQYGCTGARVLQIANDANDVLVTHEFPTVDQANGFAGDPGLKNAMARAGVAGAPQIEVFTSA